MLAPKPKKLLMLEKATTRAYEKLQRGYQLQLAGKISQLRLAELHSTFSNYGKAKHQATLEWLDGEHPI